MFASTKFSAWKWCDSALKSLKEDEDELAKNVGKKSRRRKAILFISIAPDEVIFSHLLTISHVIFLDSLQN